MHELSIAVQNLYRNSMLRLQNEECSNSMDLVMWQISDIIHLQFQHLLWRASRPTFSVVTTNGSVALFHLEDLMVEAGCNTVVSSEQWGELFQWSGTKVSSGTHPLEFSPESGTLKRLFSVDWSVSHPDL